MVLNCLYYSLKKLLFVSKISFLAIVLLLGVSCSSGSSRNSENKQSEVSSNTLDDSSQKSLSDKKSQYASSDLSGDNVDGLNFSDYELVVYKSPTCGCCTDWVEAMQKIGYKVVVHNSDEQLRKIKSVFNIDYSKQSCHTSLLEGYVLEGHIHPDSVARLLKERPKIRGLYLPGMVAGSVGMEQGNRFDRYAILSIDHNNKVSIYDIYN